MKHSEKDKLTEILIDFPVIKTACKKSNVSRATCYRWLKEDKLFAKKVKAAIKEGVLSVNDMAEENLITMIQDKEMGAIKYWLRHHHKEYSRNGYIPVIYANNKRK